MNNHYTRGEKEFLLKIARISLEKKIIEDERFEPQTVNQKLWEKHGVVVHLYKNNNLIATAGEDQPNESVLLLVRDMTLAAAANVSSGSLKADDLVGIKIEIRLSFNIENEDEEQKVREVSFKEGEI